MTLPMLTEQQDIYDERHCQGCNIGLDPADAYRIAGMRGIWCKTCFKAEMEREAEESHWCNCGGGPYCPGPHRPRRW